MVSSGARTTERTARRPGGRADTRLIREIVTPEGVPLRIELGSRADRFGALIIDLVLIAVLFFVVFWALRAGFDLTGESDAITILYILISFVIRNGYFMIFELKWRGRTPGKAAVGLRVIDRDGGRLTTEAVVTRNALREIEVFIPWSLALNLLLTSSFGSEDETFFVLALFVWSMVFALFPMFNRDRMRCGDLVAGTLVARMPKFRLLDDLAKRPSVPNRAVATGPSFTETQLKAYGIYELQTLERVLRSDRADASNLRREVAKRIQRKIKWTGGKIDDRAFLEAYYAALRRHLESKMLFGVRREDKFDNAGR
jgi:uncharacterized RDD family membrane protein YckC